MEWDRLPYRDEEIRHQAPRNYGYDERGMHPEARVNYRGRGPKDYVRSDERIREDVCDRLAADSNIDASDLDVAVARQEVTVSGTVPNNAQLQRLEECVWDISGVRLVQNNVRVRQRSKNRETRDMWPIEGPADADMQEAVISSDRVIGSSVHGTDGRKIGTLEKVLLKRNSGRVVYAVLGFGGFLGIGTDHYPVPWQMLHFDERLDGYVADLTKRDIEHAPRFSDREAWNWDNEDTARQIDGYYRERIGMRSAHTDAYAPVAAV